MKERPKLSGEFDEHGLLQHSSYPSVSVFPCPHVRDKCLGHKKPPLAEKRERALDSSPSPSSCMIRMNESLSRRGDRKVGDLCTRGAANGRKILCARRNLLHCYASTS